MKVEDMERDASSRTAAAVCADSIAAGCTAIADVFARSADRPC